MGNSNRLKIPDESCFKPVPTNPCVYAPRRTTTTTRIAAYFQGQPKYCWPCGEELGMGGSWPGGGCDIATCDDDNDDEPAEAIYPPPLTSWSPRCADPVTQCRAPRGPMERRWSRDEAESESEGKQKQKQGFSGKKHWEVEVSQDLVYFGKFAYKNGEYRVKIKILLKWRLKVC